MGHGNVCSAVCMEVAQEHALGPISHGKIDRILKTSIAIAQQDAYIVASVVGSDQVKEAIAVEIVGLNAVCAGQIRRWWVSLLCLKGAIPIAQQNAHVIVGIVRYCQVKIAVPKEVAGAEEPGRIPSRVRHLGFKGAIPTAQQTAHRIVVRIGDCQIQLAIFVEIPYDNRPSGIPDGVRHLWFEGAIPVPNVNTYGIGAAIGYDQIQLAVTIEVTGHDIPGVESCSILNR